MLMKYASTLHIPSFGVDGGGFALRKLITLAGTYLLNKFHSRLDITGYYGWLHLRT